MSQLLIGAIGVVYGDIGTSPLYTLRQCFGGLHPLALTPAHILGVLSIIFWSLVIIVTLKYVALILRADNRGEGGILALTALVTRGLDAQPKRRWWLLLFGIVGAAMFYGDGMITPAISVLGAVEGLEVLTPRLHPFVLPLALGIITALFMIQRSGTARVGAFFGPVMVVWFATLAVLGLGQIIEQPAVLAAINPAHAIAFIVQSPRAAFLALGAVVLAVTGTEALYADMGHFGRTPIRRAWLGFVMPALVLNYFGQGALLLADPAAIKNPFYLLAPTWALVPLILLATCAAVIASQAVISGAFSLTRAAIQMGYCPRLTITHTSDREIGQIYVPFINWVLFISVMLLVARLPPFGQSGRRLRHRRDARDADRLDPDLLGDGARVEVVAAGSDRDRDAARADRPRVPRVERAEDPVGRLVSDRHRRRGVYAADDVEDRPFDADDAVVGRFVAARRLHPEHPARSAGPGTRYRGLPDVGGQQRAAFVAAQPQTQQGAARTRRLPDDHHARHPVRARRGALTSSNRWAATSSSSPATTAFPKTSTCQGCSNNAGARGFAFAMMETSFFVSRESLIATGAPGMAQWRERLFVSMSKNATKASDYFGIPTNRVVELGTQVEI